jgi:hypothetical protein
VDTLAELAQLHLPIGRIIINAARAPLLTGGQAATPTASLAALDRSDAPTRAQLRAGLVAAGLPAGQTTVAGLHAETRDYLARERLEARLRAELTELGRPTVELPLLPDGANRAGLATLAAALRAV